MELSHLYDHNMNYKMAKQEMYFPIDVMTNILNRLPSTSIARFQTVSKHWCHTIHDILNAHSKTSLTSVQLSTNKYSGKVAVINFDDEGKTKTSIHKINLGRTSRYNFSNMVNGIASAYGTTTLCLINLTTFETSKYLKRKIEGATITYDRTALGFDPSTLLYKLIRTYYHSTYKCYRCEILEIGFLFKSNWKIIGNIPHDVDLDNPVFLDGALHWMKKSSRSHRGKSRAFDYLKLDMKEDKFELVATTLQNEFDLCDYEICNCYFTLTEENGKLYVLHYCWKKKYLDGWILKESKGYRVWNAVFHVNIDSMVDKEPDCLLGQFERAHVVGIVDGKVLMRSKSYDRGVYIYDLLHKKFSKHWDVNCGSFYLEHGIRRMLLCFFTVGSKFLTSKCACSIEDMMVYFVRWEPVGVFLFSFLEN